jgi:starch synthase
MKVLFATAEALPYWKTGGLADVARSLPDALVAAGHDVRIILPGYRLLVQTLAAATGAMEHDATLSVPWPGAARSADVVLHRPAWGAAAAFVQARGFFETDRPYEPVPGDILSLGRRFAFFCRSVVAYANHWGAHLLHLNDWQTGLVPLYALLDGTDAASLFTIHNLAYQGNFPAQLLSHTGVPTEFMRTQNGLEFYGQVSFMKGGIAMADRLSTVSPTYAREIRTPEFGTGLQGLLTFRRQVLHGVLNGIDTDSWNPTRDPLLPATYDARSLKGKDRCREQLAVRAGVDSAGPILGVVTRLAHQKGIDILLGALPELLRQGCSVVILGSGEPAFEHALAGVAAQAPDRIAISFAFDEPLAHLIYAGADFFLMPSIYEPCGLGQMIAQRYGTPPIGRRTGGLTDTIDDNTTGFLFDDPAPHGLAEAVARAVEVWKGRGWRVMQRRCMDSNNSWGRSAMEYVRLYELTLGATGRTGTISARAGPASGVL